MLPQDTTLYRRRYMKAVSDADGAWVNIDTIPAMFRYQKLVTGWLLKIGLIETRQMGEAVEARITPTGRKAYAEGKLKYRDNQKPLAIPREVYEGLLEIAKELDTDSITGLLRHIVARQGAFVRWFKHITAEKG